ncbi:MAG: site-2 protease family protein [Deltaproteobacteria bacterium]|nr:site-2 protease family protein [Deltaproteobacteria bacterium]
METVFYALLMIGPLIIVHELGHYLLARWMGVHVVEFAIGVGPKLFTKKGKQTRPDLPPTEYTIGALPFGGFVKMLGTDPGEEVPPEIEEVSFNARPVWRRFLVMAAGPVFNFALALVIYFAAGLGTSSLDSSLMGAVDYSGPAWQAGFRPGDRIVAIDGEDTRYFWQVVERLEPKVKEVEDPAGGPSRWVGAPVELTWERHGERITKTFETRASMEDRVRGVPALGTRAVGKIGVMPVHVLGVIGVEPGSVAEKAGLRDWDRIIAVDGAQVDQLTVALDALWRAADRPVEVSVLSYVDSVAGPVSFGVAQARKVTLPAAPGNGARGLFTSECLVHRVVPGSPADKAGLKSGDHLLRFDGVECAGWEFFAQRILQAGDKGGRLAFARRTAPGSANASEILEADVKAITITWPNELKKDATAQVTGIQVLYAGTLPEVVANEDRLSFAWHSMVEGFGGSLTAVVSTLGGLFSGRLAIKDGLGGPVMMGQVAAKTAERGWGYFFFVMAGFSVSLGLINLLPIPILDGGQILFLAIEGIRRRPVSMRTRMIATYAGLAFVVLLMVIVFRYDIERCMG